MRKDAFLFARRTRRWWSAPARFSVAMLARHPLPANRWLYHAPAGIHSPLGAQ